MGTQANDKSTKNADESAKATKVLRTTAKHDAWTAAGYEKNHQNTVMEVQTEPGLFQNASGAFGPKTKL